MFNPCLLVMNPRRILRCLRAIDALQGVDKFWLSFMWESELVDVIATIIHRTPYSHYIVISDDGAPTQEALDLVCDRLLATSLPEVCVTGYCNNYIGSSRVNITRTPFAKLNYPDWSDYDWFERDEVERSRDRTIRTHFAGMALTGMSREMWTRFPFQVLTNRDARGYCSDWSLSRRLQDAGIPILAPKGAFMEHVSTENRDQSGERELLNGKIRAEVRWQHRGRTLGAAGPFRTLSSSGFDLTVPMRSWTLDPLHELLDHQI